MKTLTIKKEILGNIKNPHYFIFKGPFNFINKDSIFIDLLPFEDAGKANKYAKKNGYFAQFANQLSYSFYNKK